MTAQPFTLDAPDGTRLAATRYDVDSPTAAVIVCHGMGEHQARYARFAAALNDAGYAVYTFDQRGHGDTAGSAERFGDLGDAGWPGLVSDIGTAIATARAEHPGGPVAVFGHSMGSFGLQQFLLDHSADLDAAALSGTTALDLVGAGIDPSAEMDLSMFNAAFTPARTDYDWLSRDEAEVDAYVADPRCGFGLNPAGVGSMVARAADFGDPAALAAIRHDLPIYVCSGDADPLAGGGDLVQLVGQRYRDAGVTDVEVKLYPGGRHEVLNETNRDEVTADLIAWLDRVVGS